MIEDDSTRFNEARRALDAPLAFFIGVYVASHKDSAFANRCIADVARANADCIVKAEFALQKAVELSEMYKCAVSTYRPPTRPPSKQKRNKSKPA